MLPAVRQILQSSPKAKAAVSADFDPEEWLAALNKRGSRLGGATGAYFLRFSGWDAWIASSHVCAALMREGVLDKPEAKSKRDLAALQDAINAYHDDSGLPRAQISRLLAMSIG